MMIFRRILDALNRSLHMLMDNPMTVVGLLLMLATYLDEQLGLTIAAFAITGIARIIVWYTANVQLAEPPDVDEFDFDATDVELEWSEGAGGEPVPRSADGA